jgi:phosphoglycerate dehydrogenase-like enzyme
VAALPASSRWIDAAIEAGGGRLVTAEEATALVWTQPDGPEDLAAVLDAHTAIDWVQLPWAGVEPYVHLMHDGRTWSCAKGVYAPPVAEHALGMALAGFHQLQRYSRAETWTGQAGKNLRGAKVTIVGGGGIAEDLIALLEPFACDITVVRRTEQPLDGVARVLTPDRLHDALRDAELVVLALALVEGTHGIIGAQELALMAPDGWLVNVARGPHVDTDALVDALAGGRIGGAALDVTDPEPLPDGHPLWSLPNVLITPHTANTRAMARPLLSARITDNVRRYAAGETLVGLVDVYAGY